MNSNNNNQTSPILSPSTEAQHTIPLSQADEVGDVVQDFGSTLTLSPPMETPGLALSPMNSSAPQLDSDTSSSPKSTYEVFKPSVDPEEAMSSHGTHGTSSGGHPVSPVVAEQDHFFEAVRERLRTIPQPLRRVLPYAAQTVSAVAAATPYAFSARTSFNMLGAGVGLTILDGSIDAAGTEEFIGKFVTQIIAMSVLVMGIVFVNTMDMHAPETTLEFNQTDVTASSEVVPAAQGPISLILALAISVTSALFYEAIKGGIQRLWERWSQGDARGAVSDEENPHPSLTPAAPVDSLLAAVAGRAALEREVISRWLAVIAKTVLEYKEQVATVTEELAATQDKIGKIVSSSVNAAEEIELPLLRQATLYERYDMLGRDLVSLAVFSQLLGQVSSRQVHVSTSTTPDVQPWIQMTSALIAQTQSDNHQVSEDALSELMAIKLQLQAVDTRVVAQTPEMQLYLQRARLSERRVVLERMVEILGKFEELVPLEPSTREMRLLREGIMDEESRDSLDSLEYSADNSAKNEPSGGLGFGR